MLFDSFPLDTQVCKFQVRQNQKYENTAGWWNGRLREGFLPCTFVMSPNWKNCARPPPQAKSHETRVCLLCFPSYYSPFLSPSPSPAFNYTLDGTKEGGRTKSDSDTYLPPLNEKFPWRRERRKMSRPTLEKTIYTFAGHFSSV